ncbi:MAG: prolyl oligopeptidase family serine peptidase [Deltaproteobacteria bacterium]|nr:prolyl oligopeptidase family serine peptidase [Deltaproteobacteria bacterium]
MILNIAKDSFKLSKVPLILIPLVVFHIQTKELRGGVESEIRSTTIAQKEQQSSQEQTSKNSQFLRLVLSRNPEADTNGDGVLTMEEARILVSKLREEEKPRRRRCSGYPFDLKEFYEERFYTRKDKRLFRYYLMKPEHYDSRLEYPLVVCLHAGGGKSVAARVLAESEKRAKYPCFVFVPEANDGEDWGKHPDPIRAELMTNIQPLVLDAIAVIEKDFSIDEDRIYVTGHSFGGFGTFAFIFRNPTKFAAAVPICGYCDPAIAPIIAKIPIWMFHGAQDRAVTVDYSRNMVDAIKKAGGIPKYTEYPNVGHEAVANAYATEELWEWLFAQTKKHS